MDTIKADAPAEDITEDLTEEPDDELDNELGEDVEDEPIDEPAAEAKATATTRTTLTGAAAVVAAALGLSSLTGTWIGTLMSDREQLIGQIASQSGSSAKQIADIYGTPWHTVALFNGTFALAAIIVAAVTLLLRPSAPWAKAVAWGALALGVLGLLIAGVMYFDVFTHLPVVTTTSTSTTTTG
ncbi:MAG: hypothetical protein JWR52_3286 [Marmoricola sp.]|jgi:hypothetical protein|uniref:hypothetical protein n=1 Tax=Actinacidiphila oryziradicis TaxID=2571141 RepID=UPI0023F04AE2|nr:hypothetical protein [Actinacidiphila oryziradicis]MCW2857671.1 hypothetical protein [Marmoricola sp.]MCW2875261.1 hypothetical protein [Actinacidiphila oryziradicis]